MSKKLYIGCDDMPSPEGDYANKLGNKNVHFEGRVNILNDMFSMLHNPDIECKHWKEYLNSNQTWYYILTFCNTDQLYDSFELDIIDPDVLDNIMTGNCKLLLVNLGESHLSDPWMASTVKLFDRLVLDLKLPGDKIVWMSNGIHGQQAWEAYTSKHGLDDHGIHHVTFKEFFLVDPNVLAQTDIPRRRFMFLQKNPRHHRMVFANWMHKHKIDAHMSFDLREDTKERLKDSALKYTSLGINLDDIEEFYKAIPLSVDGANLQTNEGIHLMPFNINNPKMTIALERTGIQIVGETYLDHPGVFFTEKTIKPIISKCPFIILGQPGSLTELRKLGFKTFGPLIDESYDLIQDHDERMLAVANEVLRLSELSDSDFGGIKEQTIEVCEHNFHNLHNFSDRAFNINDLIGHDDE